jgi:hypothetical protein
MVNDPVQEFRGTAELSNSSGFQNSTSLQLRLSTDNVVRQVEMYLRGVRTVVVQDQITGLIREDVVWKGKPLVNDEGLQGIMNFVEIIFNPSVVQGNFLDYDMYADYLERTRKDLSDHLMKNFYAYGISEDNYNGIIDTLMRFIEPYMSRLLFNKERDSYAQTIKSVESTQSQPNKSGFKLPWIR